MKRYKTCTICGKRKLLSEYHWQSIKYGKRVSRCRACVSAYGKKHYQANIEKYKSKGKRNRDKARRFARGLIWKIKNVPCADCGMSYPPWVMQFDHVRGKKMFNIATAVAHIYPLSRLQSELPKCDVVCANCHAARTHQRIMQQRRRRGSKGGLRRAMRSA